MATPTRDLQLMVENRRSWIIKEIFTAKGGKPEKLDYKRDLQLMVEGKTGKAERVHL